MAKYSKAVSKSVKTAMRKMKKGKLTSGTSGKKVTSKKQAVAIGLSEAREKGAKVPAKKSAPAKKKAAAKKPAAAKKTAPKKAVKKTSVKKSSQKKAASKSTSKAAPKKKAAAKKKSLAKKSPAKKTSAPKKTSPAKSNVKKREKSADAEVAKDTITFPSEIITNSDITHQITPEAEQDIAVFSATQPDQKWIPADLKASPQDPFHGNINPSKAKTSVKPSGKKPLWDSRK